MKARLVLNRLAAQGAGPRDAIRPPSSSTRSSRSPSSPSGWPRSATRTSSGRWPTSTAWPGSGSSRALAEPGRRAAVSSRADPARRSPTGRSPSPCAEPAAIAHAADADRRAVDSPAPIAGRGVAPVGEPQPAAAAAAAKAGGEPRKAKVAETIRVESDRLDHLMNLAGELVINKARFVDIARGLEELFRGSNAQALATDTEERLESITRGLDGIVGAQERGRREGSVDRWAGHVRRLRDNFREIQDELEPAPRGPRAAQGARRGDPQPGPGLRRPAEGGARHADGADRPAVRAVPPRHPRPQPLLGQGGRCSRSAARRPSWTSG